MRNDLEKMANPASWPMRTLCLKRYLPNNQMEFADLMRRGEDKWMFVPLDFGAPKIGDKTMLAELVNDGWLVD